MVGALPPLEGIEGFVRRERAAVTALVVKSMLAAMVVVFALSFVTPTNEVWLALLFDLPPIAILVGCLALLRRGHAVVVGWFLSSMLLVLVFCVTWFLGGLDQGASSAYIVTVMIAGATLGMGPAIFFGVMSVVGCMGAMVGNWLGVLPPSPVPPSDLNALVTIGISMLLTCYLLHLSLRSLTRAVEQAEKHAERRKEAEAQVMHSQKLDLAGRLAGGVAHDLNNLLTVMFATESTVRPAVATDPQANRALDDMKGALQRAAVLTKQLLALSRPPILGQGDVGTDVGDVVGEFIPLLSRLVDDTVTVSYECTEDGLVARASVSAVEQIVLNLVVNARDAMPNGGEVTVSCAREGDDIVLEVADGGLGIRPEDRDAIFEPFFTTKEGGTGLGLAMIQQLVNRLGGRVDVDSSPAEGSTFRVFLPATDIVIEDAGTEPPFSRTHAARGEISQSDRRHERILVVENDDQVRRAVVTVLERAGYEVVAASDALEAFSTVECTRISLVVTDASLPTVGGVEFRQRLRELDASVPLVLLGGDKATELDDDYAMTRCIDKPFTRDRLLYAVDSFFASNDDTPPSGTDLSQSMN